MPLHKKMEFEGKDVAEAISNACKTLNVSQENLDIEVLTTGTSGIFGLCRQKARLRVALKKEESEPVEPQAAKRPGRVKSEKERTIEKKKEPAAKEKKKGIKSKPVKEARETVKEAREDFVVGEDLRHDLQTGLGRILELMNYPSEVTVSSDKENVTALIQGEYVNEIVEQNGKVLDSLQYLLRKIISKKYSEKAIISLDAGDFRAARTEELKQLALEFAGEVKKSGKTRSIPSLNPSERRVVHLALQEDKDVRSRSVGEGLFKKVLIYRPGAKDRKSPARKQKSSNSQK
jgi:spoIIIJ-associated protein